MGEKRSNLDRRLVSDFAIIDQRFLVKVQHLPYVILPSFPHCQVRVVDFIGEPILLILRSPSPRHSSLPSFSPILFAKCLANPLCQVSRQSSSPSVLPILFTKCLANPPRQLRIAVSTAGPQPPGSDRSEHRWTSTARARAQ